MMPFWDPTMILLIPAILLTIWAQAKVHSAYAHFSKILNRRGLTGADVAAAILRDEGITLSNNPALSAAGASVALEAVPGHLTDHYDPRARTLRLSDEVYRGTSVAALGIAAHEVGHAIQHAQSYAPLTLRNVVYPVCNIGTMAAWPLFLVGLFMGLKPLLMLGIVFFTLAVFFTVLTLPVEFNASSRAMRALAHGGYLTEEELGGARKVLNAAALTYVAAAAVSVMHLVRMLILANDRR
jgi:Zn-dependent membrane protease YugP